MVNVSLTKTVNQVFSLVNLHSWIPPLLQPHAHQLNSTAIMIFPIVWQQILIHGSIDVI